MAQEITGNSRTFVASAAIGIFRCVTLTTATDNNVTVNTSNATANTGISQATASAGQAVSIQLDGTTKAKAASAITKGAYLKASTLGKVAPTTNAGDSVIGIAMAAADANDIIEILLTPGNQY